MKAIKSAARQAGNAVVAVLLLVLVAAMLLGGNYVRNFQADQAVEKSARPYAKYRVADLEVLAEGYRTELASPSRTSANRVQTRTLHHFSDQVVEFERVQREARKSRDKAMGVAQLRRDLDVIEAELKTRAAKGSDVQAHLSRMFRI